MVLPEMPENVGIFEAVQMGDPINGENWFHLICLIVLGQAALLTLVTRSDLVWLEPRPVCRYPAAFSCDLGDRGMASVW